MSRLFNSADVAGWSCRRTLSFILAGWLDRPQAILDNSEVRSYLGVWDCGGGKLWIDDVRLVDEPLVNLVRRPGCPLLVQDADGLTPG